MNTQPLNSPNQGLQQFDFFEDLPPESLEKLASNTNLIQYPRHSMVVHQNDPNCGLYIVAEGLVKAYRLHTSGRQRVIKLHSAGSLFGNMTIGQNPGCVLQAEALEASKIYVIKLHDLQSLIQNDMAFALKLMNHMAHQLEASYLELEAAAYDPAYKRTCNLLIQLCDDLQITITPGCIIDLRVTQEDMAEMLGLTRMTITKVVRELRKKAILTGRSGNLRLDHDALQKETLLFD